MSGITADPTTLMNQAPMTMQVYMAECIRIVDGVFGAGYAKKNPQLLSAMVLGCAVDYSGGIVARAIEMLQT
jgi:hypothetical protein